VKAILSIGLAICLTALTGNVLAQSDALNKIKTSGVIKVGINPDYRPFGERDSTGKIIGIEPDLAQDIAKRLGVNVEIVPVQPANRIQFLQQGRIDLILSTMTYNNDRAKVVDFIQPFYYAGGTGLIGRKGVKLNSWNDLRDKTVCGVAGTYYNRAVSEKYGVQIAAFADVTQAINALINNSCIAFVEDSNLVVQLLADPKLKDFGELLPPDDLQPWGMAIALPNANTPYEKVLKDTATSWHKDGTLIALEKKWGLPPSDWLIKMRDQNK
jgi:polar amino acid transport system substrate-binding protein